jgi:hypothetical protein
MGKGMKIENLPQEVQRLGDYVSVGAVVGTILGWLPHIATALTVIWMAIRIIETDSFQKMWSKLRGKKSDE